MRFAEKYDCPMIVRVSAKDFGFDGTVFSIPLYAAVLVGDLA